MRLLTYRQIIFVAIIMMLLVSGCGESPDPTPIAPVATVDVSEIAELVLSEIETQLGEPTEPEAANTELDSEAIVQEVLAQVEGRFAQQEEAIHIALETQAPEMAVETLETSLVELYQQANPAVVFIIVPPFSSGSGFVYSEDGYIVTNNHVVGNGRRYEVVFADGERRQAELVGRDVDSDLAVIKVEQLPAGAMPLPLASSDELRVGQFVAAIGNPFGEQGSMSLGIISGLDRSLSSQRETSSGSSYSLPEVIQTDAPINPGNSGGPLLNLNGEVVGVNSAISSRTGTNSGVGFSIPVSAVKQIVPSLIETGSYEYPYMGAAFDETISLGEQSTLGLTQTLGAYVIGVTEGSPAEQAGLIPANPSTGRGGDLVVAIDGNPINDFADLNSYLVFETAVGQTIQITVLRGGEAIEISLTLGSRPQ